MGLKESYWLSSVLLPTVLSRSGCIFLISSCYGLMKNSTQCVDKTGGKSTGEGQIAVYIGFKGVLLIELCTFTNRFVQERMYIFDKPMLWPHEK